MKKIYTILIITSIIFASCKKKEQAEIQDPPPANTDSSALKWEYANGGNTVNFNINTIRCFNNSFFAVTDYSIFRSADNGDTWIEKNNGLPTNERIGQVSGFNNQIYLITHNRAIYKSTDEGESWQHVVQANWLEYFSIGSYQSIFILNTNQIYVTIQDSLFKSSDAGQSWTLDFAPAPGIFSRVDSTHFFTNSNSTHEIYDVTNNGTSWNLLNGYPCNGGNVNTIPAWFSNKPFFGCDGSGVYYYNFTNQSWMNVYSTAIVGNLLSTSDKLIASMGDKGLFISTDGTQWNDYNQGWPKDATNSFYLDTDGLCANNVYVMSSAHQKILRRKKA